MDRNRTACLQFSLRTNGDVAIRPFTDELLWIEENGKYHLTLDFDDPTQAANAAIRTLARISGNLHGKLYVTHYLGSVIRSCINDIDAGNIPVYRAFDGGYDGYIKFGYD